MILSNQYFPETASIPLGVGTDRDGNLLFELRQKFIPSLDGKHLPEDMVEKWAEERGWILKDNFLNHYVSKGGDLACLDLHGENVVKDKNGNMICIDPCVLPNIYELELGGGYQYEAPAKHFDSGEYEEEMIDEPEDDEYAQYADFEGDE